MVYLPHEVTLVFFFFADQDVVFVFTFVLFRRSLGAPGSELRVFVDDSSVICVLHARSVQWSCPGHARTS